MAEIIDGGVVGIELPVVFVYWRERGETRIKDVCLLVRQRLVSIREYIEGGVDYLATEMDTEDYPMIGYGYLEHYASGFLEADFGVSGKVEYGKPPNGESEIVDVGFDTDAGWISLSCFDCVDYNRITSEVGERLCDQI